MSLKGKIIVADQPIHRLVLSLEKPRLSAWYQRFLTDPIGALGDAGTINRIVLVGAPENPDEFDSTPPEDISPDRRSIDQSSRLDISQRETSIVLEEKYKYQELGEIPDDIEVMFKEYRGRWTYKDYWEFLYFNYPLDDTQIDLFGTLLEAIFPKYKDPKEQLRIIGDESERADLRDIYKEVFNDNVNRSSIVLYHGPIGDWTFDWLEHWYWIWRRLPIPHDSLMNIGSLLTGDLDLKTNKVLKDILDYFKNKLNRVGIFQVPHHGSIKNWDSSLPTTLPNCMDWVISSSTTHKTHPDRKIFMDTIRHERRPRWANEFNSVNFRWGVVFR